MSTRPGSQLDRAAASQCLPVTGTVTGLPGFVAWNGPPAPIAQAGVETEGRGVSNPYRRLFAIPGARGFVAAGLVGRLPIAMLGIGTVLLVQSATGSYGLAGAVAASAAIAGSLSAPTVGRWIDRLGQARVLMPSLVVHASGLAGLLGAAVRHTPAWTLFVAAAVTGAGMPPVSSCVRARWATVAPDAARLHAAYSLESVLDEVIFVVGPVLVTLLAATVSPVFALASTLVFSGTGVSAFAAQRATEPAPSGRPVKGGPNRRRSAIRLPGLRVVATAFVGLGAVFGGLEVSMVAFANEHGSRGLAGPLLAVLSGASLVAGLAYGARTWRAPLHRRFVTALLVLAVGTVPLVLAGNVAMMVVAAAVGGLAVSPALISGYGLVERLVPARALTEGLTWVSTSVGVGIAVGSSAAGRLVDLGGFRWGFGVCVTAAALAAAVGLTGRRVLARPGDGGKPVPPMPGPRPDEALSGAPTG
jgi:MFS family permease